MSEIPEASPIQAVAVALPRRRPVMPVGNLTAVGEQLVVEPPLPEPEPTTTAHPDVVPMTPTFEKLRLIQSALDEAKEHIPEGTYLEAMNALQSLFNAQVPLREIVPPNPLYEAFLEQLANGTPAPTRQRRGRTPAPRQRPASAPTPAPTRTTTRGDRRYMSKLDLPDGAKLTCRVKSVEYIAWWNAETHTFTDDEQGKEWNAPSTWCSSLGKHCNGWEFVFVTLDDEKKKLAKVYDEQNN